MERDTFAERLHEAACLARDFARRFVEEALPDELAFRVSLNDSHDGNPLRASLSDVRITAAHLVGDARMPRQLASLSLHLRDAREPDLERLLESVQTTKSLHLQGTPIGDALFERAVTRLRPQYVNVVDTRVSAEAFRRVAASYPSLRMHHTVSKQP